MTIHYELTKDDFRRALLLHRRKNKRFSLTVILLVLFTILGVVLPILAMRDEDHDLFLTVLPIVIAIVFWMSFFVAPRTSAKKQFGSSPSSQGRIDMEVSESGIHFRSANAESTAKWQTFVRCLEDKWVLMLMSSAVMFVVIPKRAFTPEQLNEFRSYIPETIWQ